MVKILIILDAKINSYHNFSTFKGMKLKEPSSKNLLRQWNKRKKKNLFEKNVGKINDQHTPFPMLPMTIKGGKKMKIWNY